MTEDLKNELIALLLSLRDCTTPEDDEDSIVLRIQALSPDPDIIGLVFHPKPDGPQTIEAAVDQALRYKPIRI